MNTKVDNMKTIISKGQIHNVTEISKIFNNVTQFTNQTDIDEEYKVIGVAVENAIYGFAVISIIINTLNILAIVSAKLYRKLSYGLIVNLSLCDALVSISVPGYFIIVEFKPGWLDVLWLTVVVDYIFTILSLATLLTVLSMTCELFYMIKYPLKHLRHFQDGNKYKIVLLCIWSLATVPAILLDFIVPLFRTDISGSFLEEAVTDTYEPYCFSVVIAVLAFFIMTFLYSVIIKEIYKSRKMTQTGVRNIRKSAVTVCLIVLTYFLLYLPYWITVGMYFLDGLVLTIYFEDTFDRFYIVTFLCQIVNTACDPLIYAFRIKVIRQSAKKLFYKSSCRYLLKKLRRRRRLETHLQSTETTSLH